MKNKGILLTQYKATALSVYNEEVRSRLPICEEVYTKEDIVKDPSAFQQTEYIFSTWGMPTFTETEIQTYFPVLRAVFYAAGTVKDFALPFLKCGVRIFSAWQANAIPVAEFTLSQILLATKGYFRTSFLQSRGDTVCANQIKAGYCGNYGAKIGIIGAGMIGKKVISLLKPFQLSVLVYDAFLSEEEIRALGAEKVALTELFSVCNVVSNHLADKPETRGILNYDLFSRMPQNATFLNTGRGAQVDEDSLVRILKERTDLTALLDVTDPEPPVKGHPFYSLPNCFLSPHIAGSSGNEVMRMGEYMENAYSAFLQKETVTSEVTENMLKTMA